MDQITKALKKLNPGEREAFKGILQNLQAGYLVGFDIQKLKGRHDVYRLRKGVYRIIFRKDAQGVVYILAFERRSDTTYHQG